MGSFHWLVNVHIQKVNKNVFSQNGRNSKSQIIAKMKLKCLLEEDFWKTNSFYDLINWIRLTRKKLHQQEGGGMKTISLIVNSNRSPLWNLNGHRGGKNKKIGDHFSANHSTKKVITQVENKTHNNIVVRLFIQCSSVQNEQCLVQDPFHKHSMF